jgi:hydrolase, P-loop family
MVLEKLEDWQRVIDNILPQLKYNILLLNGDLGAGKTTFTKFLLARLGSSDEVSSPTYSIVNEYDTENGKVYHFDLYRMSSIEEVYDIGIEEYLYNGFLNIIEWADVYLPELYDTPYHQLNIEEKEGKRYVKFETITHQWD